MTLAEINRRIQDQAPQVTLYRGKGYLYYIYDDVANNVHESESISVPFLRDMPHQWWIDGGIEFSRKVENLVRDRRETATAFRRIRV